MGCEFVAFHPGDVLLQDCFHLSLHVGQLLELVFFIYEIVLEGEILSELINAYERIIAVLNHEIIEVVHRCAVTVVEHVVYI